jgi:hypothetical protein
MNLNNKVITEPNTKMNTLTGVKTSNENKVKIALPSLCDYGDSDEEEEEEITNPKLKNLAPSSTVAAGPGPGPAPKHSNSTEKKSGLLGILPPPKSQLFLKKDSTNSITNSKQPISQPFLIPRTLKNNINSAPPVKKTSSSLDEEDDNVNNMKKLKTNNTVNSFTANTKSATIYNEYKYEKDPPIKFDDEEDDEEEEEYDNEEDNNHKEEINQTAINAEAKPLADQEAWMKLCGNKRKKEEIEFIDVNAQEIVGNNRAELMKQITEEYKPGGIKDYGLGTGRKKSQITYLAFVARERDQELKAMWAQQKFAKQQAKQKYGF